MNNKPLYKNRELRKQYPNVTVRKIIISGEEIDRMYILGFSTDAEKMEKYNRDMKLTEKSTKNTWNYYGTKEQMFGKQTDYYEKCGVIRLLTYKYGKLRKIVERKK